MLSVEVSASGSEGPPEAIRRSDRCAWCSHSISMRSRAPGAADAKSTSSSGESGLAQGIPSRSGRSTVRTKEWSRKTRALRVSQPLCLQRNAHRQLNKCMQHMLRGVSRLSICVIRGLATDRRRRRSIIAMEPEWTAHKVSAARFCQEMETNDRRTRLLSHGNSTPLCIYRRIELLCIQ